MKNKTYDTLKWVALVALPAFVTFFLALAMRPTANRKEILPVGKIQIG